MGEAIFSSFDDFLDTVNIRKVNSFHDSESEKMEINEGAVEDHLSLINDFHKRTMGFSGYIGKRLDNHTGKRVEEFKVYIKRLKRDIKLFQNENEKNKFQELVIMHGDKYLKQAEQCINQIHEWGYYELIQRSMKRIEICIGNSYIDNLRKKDSLLEVIDTKHAGYNMVECDCFNYLSKLKKKGVVLNWEKLVKGFCQYGQLGNSSEVFIMSMLSYPHEFMRCVNRYRYRKKDWTDEEYAKNLIEVIAKERV